MSTSSTDELGFYENGSTLYNPILLKDVHMEKCLRRTIKVLMKDVADANHIGVSWQAVNTLLEATEKLMVWHFCVALGIANSDTRQQITHRDFLLVSDMLYHPACEGDDSNIFVEKKKDWCTISQRTIHYIYTIA